MAAGKETTKETKETPKKKSGKLKIILIFILFLILVGAGVAAFWWFQLREPGISPISPTQTSTVSSPASPPPAPVESTGTPPTDVPRTVTSVVPLPSLMVNLSDASEDRYLKVGMEVEVSVPEAVAEIQSQTARIRDSLIILLSSKTHAELASAEGKMQLKNEVASRLNQILGTPRVVRIYFTEFVVQ